MFEKLAKYGLNVKKMSVVALNIPQGDDWDIFRTAGEGNLSIDNLKVSELDKDKDLDGYDLKEAIKKHPDHLFIKCFAIKQDETNENGDTFSSEELKKAANTFIGVPIFCNHANDDIEKARGKVVHAWYDDKDGGIYVISMVDKIAYPKLARGIEEGYITGCFPPDAPVLMADGTEKPIVDIEAGDLVISGKGNVRKVLGKRQRGYKYPLYSIRVDGIKQPLVCTAGHDIIVYRTTETCACGCGERLLEHADTRITAKNFRRIFAQGHNLRGTKIKPEYIQKVKANELVVGDFLIEPKTQYESEKQITNDEAFLIGLFLAEGSYEKRDGVRHSVIFNFSHKEVETLAFQCEELLNKVFASHRNRPTINYYPDSSQTRVCLYGKEIADWFYEHCGEYSNGKKMPQYLLGQSKDVTASLLAGYVEGDGYNVKQKAYGVCTVSKDLASQIRLLFNRIGVRTRYRVDKNSGTLGYLPVHKVEFGLTTAASLREKLIYKKADLPVYKPAAFHSLCGYILRPIKEIAERDFNGVVYDIEVEEDHSYLVNHIAVGNTSMGAQVHHSYCSICHNMAHTADQYCTHVKNSKTRKFSGKVKCAYHDSTVKDGESAIEEKCPVCGCTKDDVKEITHKEALVHEHNIGLKFIENSFVVNPACKTCGVSCILNVPEFEKKVASMCGKITKMANWIGGERLLKVAGKQEVDYLNKAMKMMEVVAKSMMDQKEQVSMEYVSDIVDVLASLQTATDELVEMGYSQIPSPPSLQNPDTLDDAVPSLGQSSQQSTQQPQPQPQDQHQTSGATVSPAGGIGSVTKPSFTPKANKFLKELTKNGLNLNKKIVELNNIVNTNASIKESENTMNKNLITAAGDTLKEEHLHITTEKQIQDAKLELHPRTGEELTGVTESKEQLGLSKEPVNDTASKSPQVREGDYFNVTTENQLPDIEGAIARWEEYPEVTTEKQWTEFSRLIGSILSKDQSEHTTGAQLNDLRSHHRWTEPNYTTENQLKGEDNWLSKDNAWLDKSAAAAYSKRLVTAAINSLAEVIASYHKTPSEVVKAVNFMTGDTTKTAKAAFLTIVNGSPFNVKARKAEKQRALYFGKTASSIGAVDAVLACMGDNCTNLKAEDFVDAVRYVVSDENRLEAVRVLAQDKVANGPEADVDAAVDKFAAFDQAFNEISGTDEVAETNEDGLHQVRASFEDIGVEDEHDPLFIKLAEVYAKAKVENGDETVLYNISVGDLGDVYVTLKESSHLTENDRISLASYNDARISERESLVREAQMGGAVPDMGGAGPSAGGAGATMPAPPAPGDPTGAPPMESLEGAPGEETGEDAGDNKEPLPPGSICPVCGSEDVDIVEGKGKCNNCNSQFVFKVQVEVTRWTGVNDTNSNEEGEEGEGLDDTGLGDEGGDGEGAGEGFAMPDGGAGAGGAGAAPNIPVAAMTKLTPYALQKVAAAGLSLGSVSPITGSTNTHKLANGKYLCLDSGVSYELITLADTKNPKVIWAEWRWVPKFATYIISDNGLQHIPGASAPQGSSNDCASCRRAKTVWNKALKAIGITDDNFEKLSFIKKADTILEMDKKGLFREIKTASKNVSVVAEFKKAYTIDGDFPVKSCREKIARRFGENALAISGPCKGEKLYDCVCNQLKKASVYSDKLSFAMADTWKDTDSCLECMEDYVRFGYDITKSASICQHLKMKYASPEDLFAEEVSDKGFGDDQGQEGQGQDSNVEEEDDFSDAPDFDNTEYSDDVLPGEQVGDENVTPGDDIDGDIQVDVEPNSDGGEQIDIDLDGAGGEIPGEFPADDVTPGEEPVDSAGEHGNVTLHIPLHALDAIEQAIDKAHGINPTEEAHHNIPQNDLDKQVDVNVPEEAVNEFEGVAEDALDQEVGEGGDSEGGDSSFEGEEVPEEIESGDIEGEEPDEGDFGGNNEGEEGPEDQGGGSEMTDDNSEFKETEADHMAAAMRKGKRVGQIDMDLSRVLAVLKKEAEESGSEVKWENAQDSVGKVQDGKTIGNEPKFEKKDPEIPVGGAKAEMGKTESHPPKPGVRVPQKGPSIKNETDQGYTADGANATGGDKGQGEIPKKTPTASNNKNTKTATDGTGKKLNPPKPDSEVTKVPYSGGKDLKTTPEGLKRTPFEKSEEELNIPEKGEGAFLGDEKNSIGNIPKATQEFAPQIPTGGGMNPKYDKNEENKPEMTTDIQGIKAANKGTIGGNTVKSQKAVEDVAIRIATRMLKSSMIDDADLMKKINELKQYKLSQLNDIEKALFKTAKGLAMASDGIESSVPVADSSVGQRNSQEDLTKDLSELFTLTHRVKEAKELTDADLRARYNRR